VVIVLHTMVDRRLVSRRRKDEVWAKLAVPPAAKQASTRPVADFGGGCVKPCATTKRLPHPKRPTPSKTDIPLRAAMDNFQRTVYVQFDQFGV